MLTREVAVAGDISTHILTKRMTRTLHGNQQRIVISTHILTKRMTTRLFSVMTLNLFQLTSSRRGWQCVTLSESLIVYFNSHPHEEDDVIVEKRCVWRRYFNSHPHEEDDLNSYGTKPRNSISTHILTKRMTPATKMPCTIAVFQLTSSRRGWRLFRKQSNRARCISTHILTKRMTLWIRWMVWML